MKIKSSDFPFDFSNKKIVALHIFPLSGLNGQVLLNLKSKNDKLSACFPLGSSGYNQIYNFDGIMNYDMDTVNNKMCSFFQFFRNGSLEAVDSKMINYDNNNTIRGLPLENAIRDGIAKYLDVLQNVEIDFPYFISISFLNIKGSRIEAPSNMTMNIYRSVFGDFGSIYNDDILLPTIFVENLDDLKKSLDYCFEIFWNSDGFSGRPVTNEQKFLQ